jgi:hypothetical protein
MATVSGRSPRKADVTVSSKWVSSGDWTGKKEVSVLGGGAFHFEGLEERIFSSTAVRRQIRAGQKSRRHSESVPSSNVARKKAGSP